MELNPYEAPAARLDTAPVAAVIDADIERRAHLGREAGLRAMAVPCLLFAAYFGIMGAAFIATAGFSRNDEVMAWGLGIAFAAAAVLGLATAGGYLFLQPWVKVPAGVLAVLSLLVTFFLTLPLVGYAAWLTWSRKGLRVLSREYAHVRRQAPGPNAWTRPLEPLLLFAILGAYFALALVAYRAITAREP
jgi:hypothetical protein